MKNTLVVMSSNRELEVQTRNTLQILGNLGAMVLMERGSADVAFARCRALSWACEKLREYPERDIVLMLDDDMEVPAETAQALADKARELGCACSAVYATLTAKVAAWRRSQAEEITKARRPDLWARYAGLKDEKSN